MTISSETGEGREPVIADDQDIRVSEILFPDGASIRLLCSRAEPEALVLEFKEKTNPLSPIPTRDDRKNIAKSVSAMANGSGGTIIFGIRTINADGIDCASEAKPISDINAFEAQFRTAIFSFISPELKSWKTRVVEDSQTPGAGFLICEVSSSPDRPHMSVAAGEHTYYRRSFQGDVPMTPLEVREQILAIREAQLRLRIRRGGGAFSWVSDWLVVKADFSFLLENSGQRMCKNPFLRVQTEPAMRSYGAQDPLTARHKTDFALGLLLHIGDVLPSLTLCFYARILKDQLYHALRTADQRIARESIKLYDGNDDIHSNTITDKSEIDGLALRAIFGAENASTKQEEVNFDADFLKRMVFHAASSSLVQGWGGRQCLQWLPERELEFFGQDNFDLTVG